PPLLHAANSAAALLHPAARLDLVRCGLPVYGYPSSPALAGIGLTPALSWHARVVAVHDLAPGERVGYGGTWEAARPSRVATLSAGYADGYSRALSNRGQILIGGRRAPVVGRVSMDFLTADVTGVPGVVVGDTATLLGRQGDGMIDAAEIAGWLGTIPWEVLCLIGRRVERVYGGEVGGER
ncbi:MAG TPA: alanine racemase C-terminal domain-containing protein, partial [Candidatus Dormibacteraeota bacterium]|nr:alanine racemase C-terminal domain-containing protein [Candidatus Dormibacteraeota bacterium]